MSLQLKRTSHREDGSVIPLVAVALASLLLVLALTLDSGVAFLANTQLQKIADASARAAMASLSKQLIDDPSNVNRPQDVLDGARTMAIQVATGTTAVQGGVSANNLNVEFGRFDFGSNAFVPSTSTTLLPSAVRVTASRVDQNALARFLSTTSGGLNVIATSTVALRCRNIVMLVDVSGSGAESIDQIQDALNDVLRPIGAGQIPDRIGLVAFRNTVVDSVTSTQLEPISTGLPDIERRIRQLDDVSCVVGNPVSFSGPGLPSCVGTDLAGAFNRASDLLTEANGADSRCENLVVVLADGAPCKISDPFLTAQFQAELLGQPVGDVRPLLAEAPQGDVKGGGSTKEEARAAANALGMKASIATVVMNDPSGSNDSGERCLIPPDEPGGKEVVLLGATIRLVNVPGQPLLRERVAAEDESFLGEIISGFGQRFDSNLRRNSLARQMNAAMSTVPPVTVE